MKTHKFNKIFIRGLAVFLTQIDRSIPSRGTSWQYFSDYFADKTPIDKLLFRLEEKIGKGVTYTKFPQSYTNYMSEADSNIPENTLFGEEAMKFQAKQKKMWDAFPKTSYALKKTFYWKSFFSKYVVVSEQELQTVHWILCKFRDYLISEDTLTINELGVLRSIIINVRAEFLLHKVGFTFDKVFQVEYCNQAEPGSRRSVEEIVGENWL